MALSPMTAGLIIHQEYKVIVNVLAITVYYQIHPDLSSMLCWLAVQVVSGLDGALANLGKAVCGCKTPWCVENR